MSCDRALRWLVAAVCHEDRTVLGAGPQAVFGVATLLRDNTIHLRSANGQSMTAPVGRADPTLLAKLLMCKLHSQREYAWW